MKDFDSPTLTAIANAPDTGIVPRMFVWVTAKDRITGDPVSVGLWSGDQDISAEVISGVTGLPVTRDYFGAGELLSIDPIPLVSDLTIQTVNVDISQIATAAELIARDYDVRFGKVEIHVGLLDPVTRLRVSDPTIAFLGAVDGAPINTPAVGADGSTTLALVSDAIRQLTRINPRKRSYAGQHFRADDDFGTYSNAVADWQIFWGEAATT